MHEDALSFLNHGKVVARVRCYIAGDGVRPGGAANICGNDRHGYKRSRSGRDQDPRFRWRDPRLSCCAADKAGFR